MFLSGYWRYWDAAQHAKHHAAWLARSNTGLPLKGVQKVPPHGLVSWDFLSFVVSASRVQNGFEISAGVFVGCLCGASDCACVLSLLQLNISEV